MDSCNVSSFVVGHVRRRSVLVNLFYGNSRSEYITRGCYWYSQWQWCIVCHVRWSRRSVRNPFLLSERKVLHFFYRYRFAGLMYMLMKHFVDRYNIYFAYGPSKIKQQIHATAINFVIVSVVLLQASFMLLSIIRRGFQGIAIYASIGFIITIAFAFAQCFLRCCDSWGPIHYQVSRATETYATITIEWKLTSVFPQTAKSRAAQSPRKRDVYSQCQYVPDVLRRSTLPHREDNNGVAQNNVNGLYTSPEAVETQLEANSVVANLNEKDTTMLYQNYNGGAIQTWWYRFGRFDGLIGRSLCHVSRNEDRSMV